MLSYRLPLMRMGGIDPTSLMIHPKFCTIGLDDARTLAKPTRQ